MRWRAVLTAVHSPFSIGTNFAVCLLFLTLGKMPLLKITARNRPFSGVMARKKLGSQPKDKFFLQVSFSEPGVSLKRT